MAADDALPGLVDRSLSTVADGAGDVIVAVTSKLGPNAKNGREDSCLGDLAPMIIDLARKACRTLRIGSGLAVKDDRATVGQNEPVPDKEGARLVSILLHQSADNRDEH